MKSYTMKSYTMKLTLLVFISCLSLNTNYAQLTNAQVYDFEVGDVFQVKYANSSTGPKPIETDTVVAKYYSNGMDSLFYVMNHLVYVGSYMQSPPIYNYSIDTVIITNLNAPAQHFTYFTCLLASDTVMTSSCGVTFERLHSNYDTSCFEPQTWYSDLCPGLGGPYYYAYDPSLVGSSSEWYSKKLSYYNSNQHGECGVYQDVASLKDLALDFEVKVFPVPAIAEIQIEMSLPVTSYRIYSLSGTESIREGMIHSGGKIDVSSLKPGVYLLELSSSENKKTVRFMIHQ